MATHVHVILKQDVSKVGRAGELIRVRPGFARNYLLPRSLAAVATEENKRQVEHERKIALAKAAKHRSVADGLAAQVNGLTLEVTAQAGEGDKLFGSVTSRDVAEALHQKGIEIDRKKLELKEVIKTVGEHDVTAHLGSGVSASFKLVVKRA